MAGIYAPDGSMNVTVVSGTSGAAATEIQGTSPANEPVVGDPVFTAGMYESPAATYTSGDAVPFQMDSRGNLKTTLFGANGQTAVAVTTPSADAAASAAGLETTSQGLIFNGSTWDREKKATSVSKLVSSAATTNPTVVKASAGEVYHINGANLKATAVYLKLYNKATAPTVGTDVPVMTVHLAATSTFRVEIPRGLYFATGIGYALTTGAGDLDTGALGAADVVALNVVYS
jgi:hypothetical protein